MKPSFEPMISSVEHLLNLNTPSTIRLLSPQLGFAYHDIILLGPSREVSWLFKTDLVTEVTEEPSGETAI